MADLANEFPRISDLAQRAKWRLPHFAWEYVESGTGAETLIDLNRAALDAVRMVPRIMQGPTVIDMTTMLFGRAYDAPFGVAPIGMTGMIWPEGELMLARMAARHRIPFTLSTVACETPEDVGPLTGGMGWFQLYPPKDPAVRDDLIDRAQAAGFTTLVVTADLPAPSMRERQKRAGIKMPPNPGPRTLAHIGLRPAWVAATIRRGMPRFRIISRYAENRSVAALARFMEAQLIDCLDFDYFSAVRDRWSGPLVLKGLLHAGDVEEAINRGADAVAVSNHGGRQFDGAPAAIDVLPSIVRQVAGRVPVLFDSGIRSGLDIARAIALGADFVLLGRAFIYGLGALGEAGCDHVAALLKGDLANNMKQAGVRIPAELRAVDLKR